MFERHCQQPQLPHHHQWHRHTQQLPQVYYQDNHHHHHWFLGIHLAQQELAPVLQQLVLACVGRKGRQTRVRQVVAEGAVGMQHTLRQSLRAKVGQVLALARGLGLGMVPSWCQPQQAVALNNRPCHCWKMVGLLQHLTSSRVAVVHCCNPAQHHTQAGHHLNTTVVHHTLALGRHHTKGHYRTQNHRHMSCMKAQVLRHVAVVQQHRHNLVAWLLKMVVVNQP